MAAQEEGRGGICPLPLVKDFSHLMSLVRTKRLAKMNHFYRFLDFCSPPDALSAFPLNVTTKEFLMLPLKVTKPMNTLVKCENFKPVIVLQHTNINDI